MQKCSADDMRARTKAQGTNLCMSTKLLIRKHRFIVVAAMLLFDSVAAVVVDSHASWCYRSIGVITAAGVWLICMMDG